MFPIVFTDSSYRPDPKSRTAQEIAWQIVCEEKRIIDALESGKAAWEPPPQPAAMREVLEAYERQSAGWPSAGGHCRPSGGRASSSSSAAHVPRRRWREFSVRHRPPPRPDHDLPAADGSKVPQIQGPSADEPEMYARYRRVSGLAAVGRRRDDRHSLEASMYLRLTLAAVLVSVAGSTAGLAQQGRPYSVPRTEHGHPDFQGIWATAFLTMLERLPGVDGLVATPEQAEKVVAAIRGKMSGLVDPDVFIHDIRQLVMVKGQYRTSIIVDPADGRSPIRKPG